MVRTVVTISTMWMMTTMIVIKMMTMAIITMLVISVMVYSHGSGVGDCARYGGKGGVGCLTIIIKY